MVFEGDVGCICCRSLLGIDGRGGIGATGAGGRAGEGGSLCRRGAERDDGRGRASTERRRGGGGWISGMARR